MTLRGSSLKDCLVYDIVGPVMQNAVCLGDVDNDGANELIVGSAGGDLAVYSTGKCSDRQPWKFAKLEDGQEITSVHVGDLRNSGRNVLVAVTAEGWFHVFDFDKDLSKPLWKHRQERAAMKTEREREQPGMEEDASGSLSIKIGSEPAQEANPKSVDSIVPRESRSPSVKPRESGESGNLVEDVDDACSKVDIEGLGRKKSVSFADDVSSDMSSEKNSDNAATVDRVIYPSFTQRIPANVKETLIFDINDDGLNELVVALTDRVVRSYQWQESDAGGGGGDDFSSCSGQLVPMNKWEFGNQVGSITRNVNRDGSTVVIVAQPGGALLKLRCGGRPSPQLHTVEEGEKEPSPNVLIQTMTALDYEPLVIGQMRSLNVTCEIQGGLAKSGRKGSSPYAMATLDGALVLVRDEKVVWTMQTGQHLFSIRKLDVNGDGSDEILATSWNGTTFIVTQEKQAMEIVLDESVLCFTCGIYDVDGRALPVLVYVHREKVVVYYNLELKVGPIKTLLDTRGDQDFSDMVDRLKIRFRSTEELADFNSRLLYGW